jgi:hypothetical protein
MDLLIALLVTALTGFIVYQIRPLPAGHFTSRAAAAYEREDKATLPFYRGLLAALGPLVKYTPMG